jgi:hypothetical protein
VDLIRLADLPRLILQPSVASTQIFYNSPHGIHFLEIVMQIFLGGNPLVDGILGHSLLLSRAFWWESLRGWDFSRPQFVVVSGLFSGNPFVDGIFLGHNLLFFSGLFLHDGAQTIAWPFFRTFFFCMMEFRLSRSLSHEFSLFSRWNLGYHEAFLTNFSLFSRWDLGYHEAFLTNFLFFHNGISAITKPFSRIFLFFHDGISAITKPFSRIFLFFHDGISAITKPFS